METRGDPWKAGCVIDPSDHFDIRDAVIKG